MSEAARYSVRGGVAGFAFCLLLSLACNVSPDVSLLRAALSTLPLAAVTFLATSLNHHSTTADEEDSSSSGQTDP